MLLFIIEIFDSRKILIVIQLIFRIMESGGGGGGGGDGQQQQQERVGIFEVFRVGSVPRSQVEAMDEASVRRTYSLLSTIPSLDHLKSLPAGSFELATVPKEGYILTNHHIDLFSVIC
ncbi:hypothetical protein IQ274_32795 [Nostoc sp. LEGE 12447]|uniref:hypothetical protein n=1 Tax=Nostoc sp. LEGE 12447 TaxID=1828640 RepID=UPI001884526A|nr:hypothetical protein [Nostoc sp. LEGE 12447]MBE9002835.1 hypothetical protein [Nostoc sp. LEGE 12447]